MDRMLPKLDLGVVDKSFSAGLLLELQRALRSTLPGELFGLVSRDATVRDDLDRWARLTENSIVEVSEEPAGTRYVIRNGPAAPSERPRLGERLWLYSNFDCNLACDYCCVRSSPKVPRRALPLETIVQIASEAPALGVREIFVTGGEPLLLDEIGEILAVCARAAPTTVLTNGIPLAGRRLRELSMLDQRRIAFQISIDSSTPERHDVHRGAGSWERAMRGVRAARAEGFRVRLAGTVADDMQARELIEFFDREGVAPEDRVIRPIARRGLADAGVAVVRADLVPEITITAEGVYWHPVGADDRDLFVTPDILPLARAFDAVRQSFDREHALVARLLSVFHCA